MNITFYNIADNPFALEKNLPAPIGTARALAPTGQVNSLSPVVVVAWDSVNGNKIVNANYCYIDTFDRYYFITCGVDTAQRIVVSGKCDYLFSHADEIKNCPACILRNENIGTNYAIDKKLPIDSSRFFVEGIKFPDSELTKHYGVNFPYVLIVR